MITPDKSGLYIVTLNNWEPISVNAQDSRIAEKSIKVTRANCKFGRATSLSRRGKNYKKTFREENVNFYSIVQINDINSIEKIILDKLDSYRIKGATGKKNEWLQHIDPIDVEKVIINTLDSLNTEYIIIQSLINNNL